MLRGSGSAVSSLVSNFQGLGENLCGREAGGSQGGRRNPCGEKREKDRGRKKYQEENWTTGH